MARRLHGKINHPGAAFGGAVDDHETAAAKATHPWLADRQGQRGGDRRVDGVAAIVDNLGADFGGLDVLGGDHAAGAAHRRLVDLPGFEWCDHAVTSPSAGIAPPPRNHRAPHRPPSI